MNAPSPAIPNERLNRLLGYLGADPTNTALLSEALSLAAETRHAETAAILLAHMEQHGIQDAMASAHGLFLALQLQDFKRAAELGSFAIKGGINDQAVRFNTAYAQFFMGQYEQATQLLDNVSADNSAPADALILKARCLHHQEHYETAITLLRHATEHHADNAEALGLLALLLQEESQDEEAMQFAELALSLDPTQHDALLARADHYFDEGNGPAAMLAYQDLTHANPENGRAWSGLGQIAFDQLEFDAAEQYLQKAVQYMPNHIGTLHVLGWIYILQNQLEKAREMFLKSYALDRSWGDTHGGLAVIDAMEGKEAEARTGIRKALKLAPDAMAARYAELILLEKAGKHDEARTLVESALNQRAQADGPLRRSLVEKKLLELREKSISRALKAH